MNAARARAPGHPQATLAIIRTVESIEDLMSLLPPDDEYRPALLEVRTALLARAERAPLALVQPR